MALVSSVLGRYREVWAEATGVSRTVTTNIEMTTPKLGSVRAIIVLGTPTGAPTVAGACSIVGRKLVVTVTIAGGTVPWVLDVQRMHSIAQANNGTATVLIVEGVNAAGGLSETFSETYDIGTSAVHQTANMSNTHGGGLVLDTITEVFTDTAALRIQSDTVEIGRLDLELWGANAADQTLHFLKNRGAYGGASVELENADPVGKIDWYGYVGEANLLLARIEAVYDASRAETNSHLDFYVAHNAAAVLTWSMIGAAAANDLVGYGTGDLAPRIYPATANVGQLGLLANAWGSAYINLIGMGVIPAIGTTYSVTMLQGAHPTDLTPDDTAVIYAFDRQAGETTFCIAAEAPAIEGVPTADWGIPIYYNGLRYIIPADRTP